MRFKNLEGKFESETLKRIIYARVDLSCYKWYQSQIQCASEDVEL